MSSSEATCPSLVADERDVQPAIAGSSQAEAAYEVSDAMSDANIDEDMDVDMDDMETGDKPGDENFENSPFVYVTDTNGLRRLIRRSTFLWAIQNPQQKPSTDRTRRFHTAPCTARRRTDESTPQSTSSNQRPTSSGQSQADGPPKKRINEKINMH